MTVRELIADLERFDPDAETVVWDNDTGEYYAPSPHSYTVLGANPERPGETYLRVVL